jgi:hypothetical protein
MEEKVINSELQADIKWTLTDGVIANMMPLIPTGSVCSNHSISS